MKEIKFLSIITVPTMRGDFEILGYNMIQWLSGSLPWENNLTDPVAVQKQKGKAFENIPQFLNKCFPHAVPDSMNKFMLLLDSVEFNESPNYVKFREILVKGLLDMGHKPDGKLDFSASGKAPKILSTPMKTKKVQPKETRKSPRTPKAVTPSSPPSALNDSDLGSMIINRRGKTTKDKRRVLKSIEISDDSDAEIEIKIKRKRKNMKDENMKLTTKDMDKKLPIQYDPDEIASDNESQVINFRINFFYQNFHFIVLIFQSN